MGYYNTADRFVRTKWTSSLNEKNKKNGGHLEFKMSQNFVLICENCLI